MAVINETLSGTTPSPEVNPANATSDAIVGPVGHGGRVILEAKGIGGAWEFVSDQSGSYTVATPSTAVLYRFRGVGLQDTVHVFFGD